MKYEVSSKDWQRNANSISSARKIAAQMRASREPSYNAWVRIRPLNAEGYPGNEVSEWVGDGRRWTKGNPARRKNPTKAQKREKTRKVSARRRIAVALQNFVRKANPAARGVVKATKVKGGWNVRVVDVRRSK